MQRLLILCEYPMVLGGERSLFASVPATKERQYEPVLACPAQGDLAKFAAAHGVDTVAWEIHGNKGATRSQQELRDELAQLIKLLEPDLLHANSLSMSRLSGPVAKEHKLPSLGHLRDIVNLSKQAIADLNDHRQLIAVSEATKRHHAEQGLDVEKCTVMYNGVDLEEFAPRSSTGKLHAELGLSTDAKFLVSIGQIGLRKGTEVAFEAVRQIILKEANVHWLIVGERTSQKTESMEFEANLKEKAQSRELDGHVHFLGTRRDVPALMNECTLLLHAARQEPLGRVLLEAAASGLPCVATDVGGTREIFGQRNHGALLVPPDDPQAMADAALSLLSNDSLRQGLSSGARRRAEEMFDIRDRAPKLVDVYDQLVD